MKTSNTPDVSGMSDDAAMGALQAQNEKIFKQQIGMAMATNEGQANATIVGEEKDLGKAEAQE
jgi:hypothetical protein